jgi:hypothetical protein
MHLDPLDTFPIWVTAIMIAALLLSGCELGYRLARRKGEVEKADQAHVLSAVLGLLGLLVGFTFSITVNRHELRRTLVVEEANAIGTEYLRAQLTPEPFRTRLAEALRRYTDVRLAHAAAGEDEAAKARAEARADSLQKQLWATTVEAEPYVEPAALSSLVTAGMNALIDAESSRRAALDARLPSIAFGSLLLYAVVAAAMLGFVSGSGQHHSRAGADILLLLLTLAFALILDLDRPSRGAMNVSQQPLIDLRATMH